MGRVAPAVEGGTRSEDSQGAGRRGRADGGGHRPGGRPGRSAGDHDRCRRRVHRQGHGRHREAARPGRREGPPLRRRARRRPRPHHDRARRLGRRRRRPVHRGRARVARDQARPARARRRRLAPRSDHRQQHLEPVGDHPGGLRRASRALRGHPLLQPRAGHGAGRGRARGGDRRRHRGRGARLLRDGRQDADHRQGLARIRRQPHSLPHDQRCGPGARRRRGDAPPTSTPA